MIVRKCDFNRLRQLVQTNAVFILLALLSQLSWAIPSNKARPEGHSRPSATLPESGHPSWCTTDIIEVLARRAEGTDSVLLTFCKKDSTDSDRIGVFSKISLSEIDVASQRVLSHFQDSAGAGLTSIELFRPSLTVADVDNDHKIETFFGYIFQTDGADPTQVKFVAFKGGRSFSIVAKIPFTEMDAGLFRIKHSSGFSSAPPQFRRATDSLMKKFIKDAYDAGKLGGFLPYQMGGRRHQNDD